MHDPTFGGGPHPFKITLKKDVKSPHSFTKEMANKILEKNQSYTLGKAIRVAKDNDLYSKTLFNALRAFLCERNWLIHNFVNNNRDDMLTYSKRIRLLHRIKNISCTAKELQQIIENDLIEFSESVGVDMSRTRAAIEQYCDKPK